MGFLDLENSVTVIRGSSKVLELVIEDDSDNPVDLTGGQIYFTVKKYVDDVEPLIQKSSSDVTQIEFTDPRGGVARIHLDPADTYLRDLRDYVFDIWFINSAGKRFVVVPPSTFEVVASVTRLAL